MRAASLLFVERVQIVVLTTPERFLRSTVQSLVESVLVSRKTYKEGTPHGLYQNLVSKLKDRMGI